MHSSRTWLWAFAILAVWGGFPAQADPPAGSATLGTAQPKTTASSDPASPTRSAPQRRLLSWMRHPDQNIASAPTVGDAHTSGDRCRATARPDPTRSAPVAGRATTGPARDVRVRRTQVGPGDAWPPSSPMVAPLPPPGSAMPDATAPPLGGQSLSLQTALYGALTGNPDLVVLRQGGAVANSPSPEAVEVARRFPTTLNPTLWVDYRPITLIPPNTFGGGAGAGTGGPHTPFYHSGQQYLYLSLRQPVELGHQTTHRYRIAQAALDQQRWTVAQAELTTLVQTYRFFQTAAYYRERARVASELAAFNNHLIGTLERRLETGQGLAADVAMARIEARAARQLVKSAEQAYRTALTDLRIQIGLPETARTAEPLGEFTLPPYIPPIDEEAMVRDALASRPDIHAAEAAVRGSCSVVDLAKGDRIPTPIIGPEWEIDEAGVQYVGLVYITPIPIWNSGKPLVRQREAEHRRAMTAAQQARQRAVAQVRAAVVKWNGATDLVHDASGLTEELAREVAVLERLFEAGQADLPRLMQARQRLIQLENSRLDAIWAATQAQADLLLALGAPRLINAMLDQAQRDVAPASPASSTRPPAS
jgi:outer membrane protein, heavy metal efflux system